MKKINPGDVIEVIDILETSAHFSDRKQFKGLVFRVIESSWVYGDVKWARLGDKRTGKYIHTVYGLKARKLSEKEALALVI